MKRTTYIAEITTQKAETYLSEGIKLESTCLLAYSPVRFMSTKKFSAWFYWTVFCPFWPIKLCNLSHMVSVAPIFLGIFFYHSFYGMTSRFKVKLREGVHFYV